MVNNVPTFLAAHVVMQNNRRIQQLNNNRSRSLIQRMNETHHTKKKDFNPEMESLTPAQKKRLDDIYKSLDMVNTVSIPEPTTIVNDKIDDFSYGTYVDSDGNIID